MAAFGAPSPEPVGAGPTKFDIWKFLTDVVNRVADVIMTLPVWGKVLVLCFAMCIVGLVLYYKYRPNPPTSPPADNQSQNSKFIATQPATVNLSLATVTRDAQGNVTARVGTANSPAVNLKGQQVSVKISGDHSFDGVFLVTDVSQNQSGKWELRWSQPSHQPAFVSGGTLSSMPYSGGEPFASPDNRNDDPQNREADDKAREDTEASLWHQDHLSEDAGNEKPITDADANGNDQDPDNYVHFRYYSKTDKCVEIVRKEGGDFQPSQWIRDFRYHKHDAHPQTAVSFGDDDIEFEESRPLLASVQFPDILSGGGSEMRPSQGQFCINPHPGTFRYWWGQPINQCDSPMYRQFSDGCVHYQVYNRCANAWNPQIFWTFCHPPPHH